MKKKFKIYFFYFWVLILVAFSFFLWFIIYILSLNETVSLDSNILLLGLSLNIIILTVCLLVIVRRRYKKDKIFEKSVIDFNLLEKLLVAQKSIILIFNLRHEIIWTNNPSFFRIFLNHTNYYHLKLNKILPPTILKKINNKEEIIKEKFFKYSNKKEIKYQFLVSQINENTILFHENQMFYRFRYFFNENRSLFLILKIDHFHIGDLEKKITVEIEQKQIFPFIEFKLNQFFSKKELLNLNLRKNEFVVFLTYKQLKKLKENNFEFLEKIKKSAKNKFKTNIIFSGGVYEGYQDVVKDEENVIIENFLLNDYYQKSIVAKNMAISYGGNQIVVTSGNKNVDIFRWNQNENEFIPQLKKNYQDFLKKIEKYEKIIIVGHQNADLDVFGASLALKIWLESIFNHKKVIIPIENSEVNTKNKVINLLKKNKQNYREFFEENWDFYNQKEFIQEKTALILVDVNNHLFVDFSKNNKNNFKNIFIIDHHNDQKSFPKTEFKFIDNQISSTSEIIVNFLKIAEDENINLKIPNFIYELLSLGILIDTNNLQNNLGNKTIDVLGFLVEKKINLSNLMNEINILKNKNQKFMEKIESIKIKKDFLILKIFNHEINAVIASTIAEENLLKHNLKVIFVILYNDKKQIFISSRSKSDFDVQKICKFFGGGGSKKRAAAKLENIDVEKIIEKITQMIYENI